MFDRSVPESDPIVPLAVTSLADHPSVRWDQQRCHGDVMPRVGVQPRTPYTPDDPRGLLGARFRVGWCAAGHSAARIEGSPHVERLPSILWIVPQCVAETGRLPVS